MDLWIDGVDGVVKPSELVCRSPQRCHSAGIFFGACERTLSEQKALMQKKSFVRQSISSSSNCHGNRLDINGIALRHRNLFLQRGEHFQISRYGFLDVQFYFRQCFADGIAARQIRQIRSISPITVRFFILLNDDFVCEIFHETAY